MKKTLQFLFILMLAFFALSNIGYSQVQVGSGTSLQQIPVNAYYGYTYSQQIYLASEIGASGTITQLKFDFQGSSLSSSNDWTIYIGHTTKTSFSGGTDWVATTAMTQVYSSTFADPGTSGWITLDITDWAYNGTDNIVIAVDENASGYNGGSDMFNCTSLGSNRTVYYRSDGTNPDPTAPPTGTLAAYVPNIIFDGITQACPAPTNQTVTTITSTGAKLNWTSGGASKFGVEYGSTGFTQGTGTYVAVVNDEFLTISGLDFATDYDWYVHDSCGTADVSTWIGPNSFSTICGVYTPAYNQDFTNYVPSCWTEATGRLETNSTISGTSNWKAGGYANNGSTGAAKINNYGTSRKDWIISPSIDLNGGSYQLEFDIALTGYNDTGSDIMGSDDSLCVVISTDDGTTWSKTNILKTYTDADALSNTGLTDIIDLSSYSTTVKIGFYAVSTVSNEDYDFHLDNFKLRTPPSCADPTAQNVTNINSDEAQLNWTTGGSNDYNIEYGPTGFSQGAGTTVAVTTDEFKVISSLDANTTYDWYVQDDCGGGDLSAWIGPNTFTTVYAPIYNQDFASYTPTDWHEAAGGLETNTTFSSTTSSSWYSDGFGNNGSSGSARINIYGTSTDEWLISPSIDLSGGSYNLEFDIALTNSSNTDPDAMGTDDSLCVIISTDNGVTWSKTSILKTYTISDNITTTGEHAVIDLTAYSTTIQVGFYAASSVSNTDYNIYIDNFGIVICPMASNQLESDLQALQVQLNWTSGGASNYDIEYGTLGFVKGTGTTVSTTDTFKVITGLTAEMDYDWYVRDSCGTGNASSWTGPSSFTTLATCPAPTNQLETSLTTTSVQFNWTSGGSNNYAIEYGPTGFTQGAGTHVAVATDTFKVISLTPSTTYDWYVKDSCGTTDVSTWAGPNSFYTGYCSPSPSSVDGDGITNVSYSTVNNPSSTETNNYGDYSSVVGDAQLTSTLSVDITYETGYTYNTKIWVDWNNDLDFDDAGEEVFSGVSTDDDPTTLNASFVIPGSISLGNYRMRIGGHDSNTPSPCSTGSYGCYEDYTINVIPAPACPEPSNQLITDLNATSVQLNWTSGGSSNFNIEYGATGFTQGSGTIVAVATDTFKIITGLTANTIYDWYVQDSCGAGDISSWIGANTFSSAYVPIYTEDFTSYLPTDWSEAAGGLETNTTFTSTTSSNWTSDGFGNNGSSGAAKINIYGTSTDEWVISPSIDLSGGSYKMEFDIALTDAYNTNADAMGSDDSLCVIISTDNGITWSKTNILKTYTISDNLTTTGEHVIIDLTAYSTTIQIGFYAASSVSNTDYNIYIDNFGIVTCPMASNQLESDLQATQVQLNWTSGGSSNYNLEYGPTGFTQGAGTTTVATDTFKVISGLTANTTYDWYVQDDCGGGNLSNWGDPNTFTTMPPAHAFPLTEGFESGFDKFENDAGNSTDFADETTLYHSGAHSVSNDAGSSEDNILHETGILDLSSTSYPIIKFWHIAKTEGNYDKCYIEISTDGGQNYTALDDSLYEGASSNYATKGYFHEDSYTEWGTGNETPDNTWWKEETFDLTPFKTTDVRFRFKYHTDSGTERAGWYIDDVIIKEKPTNEIAVTQILGNYGAIGADDYTVKVEVKNNGSAAQTSIPIKYSLDGAAAIVESMSSLAAFTTDTFTFATQVNSGAAGDHILAVYSELATEEDNTNDTAYTTVVNITLPYTENLDSYTAGSMPNYWQTVNATGNSSAVVEVQNSSIYAHSGTMSLKMYNSGAITKQLLAIMPELITESVSNLQIRLWARSSGADIIVGAMSDPNDTATFVSIDTITGLTTTLANFTVMLDSYAGSGKYVAFRHGMNASSKYINIDDITLEEIPACTAPTNQVVENITATGAKLLWTSGGSTNYNIEYGPTGYTQGTGTMYAVATDTFKIITGLSGSITYDWYIQDNCGPSNTSPWLGPNSFATPINSFPYTVDFENGGSIPSDWTNDATDAGGEWQFVTTNSHCATADHSSGSGYYALLNDYNISTSNSPFYMYSSAFDMSAAGKIYNLNYWTWIGGDAASNPIVVEASTDGGANWSVIYTHDKTTTATWFENDIILTGYNTANVVLRFKGISIYAYSTDNSAIDDISISEVPTNEIEVTQVLGNYGGFDMTTTETVSVIVKNNGTAAQTSVPMKYKLDNGSVVAESLASIAAFTTDTFIFTTTFDATASGSHTVLAYSQLTGEEDNTNDSAIISFTTNAVTTIPSTFDFPNTSDLHINLQSEQNASVEITADANYGAGNGIKLIGGSSTGWTGGSSSTDVTAAFNNTTHIAKANMKVDAIANAFAFMDFDLKMSYTYGAGYSWLRVMINDTIYAKTLDGDSVWQPNTKDSDDWRRISLNLNDYAGTVYKLSFEAAMKYASDNSSHDQAFIDSINYYTPPTDEAEIISVIGDYGAIGTDDFTITAVINNNGTSANTVPINYSLDGGTAVSETTPSIAAFATDTFTFTTQVNSSNVGDHTLAVYSTLAGDADNTNDTAYTTVANIAYPYDENFDSYVAGDKPKYWIVNNTTGNSSAVAEIQSNASYAHSGTMTLKMYNSSATSDNLIAVIPKLVDGLNEKQLSFWARGNGSDIIVGVMTDPNDVSTFAAVYTVSNPPSVSSQYNVNFDNYSGNGKYVAFKHGMTSTNDYINIDDVYLGTAPDVDLGNDTTICAESSISLDAGAGSYSYSWTINGDAAIIATTQVINTDSIGTYAVKIDDGHLVDYDTIIISNYDLPTVALSGTNTICNGDSTEISMTFTGATPWDIIVSANGNLNPETGLTSPLNVYDDPSVTTDYIITQITDNNGCVQNNNSDTITITVNPLPTVDFAALNDACANDNVNLAGGTPASGWYSGNNVDSANSTFDAVTAGVGIHPITYSYTDANGCTNNAQQNQNVNSLPTVSFTALSDVCVDGASFTLSGGNPINGTYSGTGVSTGDFDPATATVGNHAITYSYSDANGCSDTAIQTQTVNALPTVTFSLNDICADASIFSLSGGAPTGGTYTGTGVDGSGNFDPSNGTQTITYTYTDLNSCTNSANTSQTVNALPDVTVIAGTNPVPYNTATSLTANVTNGVGTLSYDWSPGTSINGDSSIQAPNTISIIAATDFTVEVTDATTNCVNSNNLLVSYSGGPVSVSPTSDITAVCTGDTATLNAGGAGGTATLSYSWTSNPAGYTSTDEAPEVMPTTNTWYIIVATDGNNTDTDSIQITVNALPTITFSGLDATYCESDAVSDLTPSISGGIFTGTGVNGSSFDPNTAGAGNFDITYSYTDGNNCSNTETNSTVVNGLPMVSFTGLDASYCTNNDDATLTPNTTGGTFTGTGITGDVFSPSGAGVGNYEIIYTYTDANSCTNTDTNSTIVNGLPSVQFSGLDADYCVDVEKDTLNSLPTGGTFSGTGITANLFSPSDAGVGTFDITYSYTDANNCTNTDTNSTVVNALPIISFAGLDADYCIDGTSSTLVGTPTGGSYSGAGILGANFDPATADVGTHDITYSFTDGNGCSNNVINSTVVNTLPTVSFTGLDAIYCVDANDATLTGTPAGGTYSGTGINANSFSPSTAGDGSFDIIYNYTDANNCSNSDTNSTVVNVLPIVTVTATTNPVAYNNSTTISANISNSVGTLSYSWSSASDISGSNTLQTITTNNITVATTFIGEAYDSATTCSNADTITILYTGGPVSVNPIASNATICVGDTTVLNAQSSGGTTTVTYLWNSNPSGFSSTDENPQATPSQDTWYIVEATDGNTTAKDSVQIVLNALPTVSFTGLDTVYCINSTDASLTPSPIGGTFSGMGINASSFSPATAGVGSHDVVYTYTDANSCTNSTTNSTMVNGLPSVQLTSLESDYCVDLTSDTLIGLPSGGTFSGMAITGNVFDPSTAGVGSHDLVYSYTDANNCTNTDTGSTMVNALPTLILTLGEVCANESTFSLSGGTPTGGTYTGIGVDASGNFNPFNGTQDITYTYTDANTCTNTIITSQIVNAIPSITATAAANPVVYNNSTTLTAAVSNAVGSLSYDWSPSADLNGSNTLQTVTTNNVVMANSYIVNVTDASTSCSNTDTVELTYSGGPVSVNPIAVPTSVCAGEDATLKAQSSGGTDTINYTWTSNIGGFTSAVANPIATPTVDTWYYVSATDGTTTVDDSVFVSVNILPIVSFTGLNTANCEDAAVNNLVPSISGGIFTGTGVNGFTFNPTTAGVGNYNVTYTYTDANACTNTAVNATVVNALPSIVYTEDMAAVCDGEGVDIIVNFTGLAPFDYTYNGIDITGVNANADSIYVSPTIATTYTVTSVTDANACTSIGNLDSIQIVVNSLPTITVSDDASICIGDSTAITLNFTGESPWSYDVFDGSNVFTNIATQATTDNYVDPNTSTNYVLNSITDGNNCTISGSIDSVLITVNALPTVTASDNDTVCIGDSIQISLNFTGAAPFNFSVYDGNNTFTDNSTNALFQTYADPDVNTTYVIKSITDANACSINGDIDSIMILVNALPTPSFSGLSTSYCDNSDDDLLTGTPSGGTFAGTGIIGNTFNPSTAGFGSYDITYSYTDANGCTNTDTNSTVVDASPIVQLSGLATTYCANDADAALIANPLGGTYSGATLTANDEFSPSTSGAGAYTVYYTYTDANSCSNTDSALTNVNALPVISFITLADVCTNTASFIPTGASPAGGTWSGSEINSGWFIPSTSGVGTYYLTYSYTDVNGCTNNDSTSQVVNGLPIVSFTGLNATYCANAMDDTLVGTPTGGTYAGIGMTNNIFSPSTAGAGSYDIVYTFTDANACSNNDTAFTMVNSIPIIYLGMDTTICDNANATLDAGAGYTSYLWNTGATTQTIIADSTGLGIGSFDFSVVVTDNNNCSATDSMALAFEATPVSQLTDESICGENETITLNAGANVDYSYLWSNGGTDNYLVVDTAIIGGTSNYMYVTISSPAGCTDYDSAFVEFKEVPAVDLGADSSVCINHSIMLDAGAGFTSYLWSTGATTQTITLDSNTFIVGNNNYSVEVINSVNCNNSDTVTLVVDPCTGIPTPELANAIINVYPNPSSGQFQIDVTGLKNQEYNLDVYNSVGSVVFTDKVKYEGSSTQTWKLDFSTFAKGVYHIRLHSNGDIKVKRIAIQ